MKARKQLFTQIVKFGLVGGLCFLIDYGIMVALTELCHVPYLISSGISFTVSVVVNYMLSMRFVFQGNKDRSKVEELTIFIVLSVIGLGLNQLIMWLATDVLGIFYMLSKIGATAIVMVYNFVTRKAYLEK